MLPKALSASHFCLQFWQYVYIFSSFLGIVLKCRDFLFYFERVLSSFLAAFLWELQRSLCQGLLGFLYCSFLSCAWHQLRSIHKYLGRQGWGDYWGFLTRASCCFHHPTVLLWTRAQLGSICHNAAWLSGLKWQTFRTNYFT